MTESVPPIPQRKSKYPLKEILMADGRTDAVNDEPVEE
jgi:hypothetical protein